MVSLSLTFISTGLMFVFVLIYRSIPSLLITGMFIHCDTIQPIDPNASHPPEIPVDARQTVVLVVARIALTGL